MSQNIYDDPGFFEGYSQLARSLKGLADAPEWPSLRALLPNVQLVPGGSLVFSTEHPILMAPRQPAWMSGPERHRTWPIDSYQLEGKRTTRWLADRVVKYHRTLGTTLNTLIRQGFTLRHVEEWGPSSAQLAAHPEMAEEQDRPMFLLVSAQR